MIDNCLLQRLPLRRLLQVSRRGRGEALTVHFHGDRANKRFRDYVSSFPCGILCLIPDGDPSSAAVVIDVKTIAADRLQNFAQAPHHVSTLLLA
jgi:hypothetical protein